MVQIYGDDAIEVPEDRSPIRPRHLVEVGAYSPMRVRSPWSGDEPEIPNSGATRRDQTAELFDVILRWSDGNGDHVSNLIRIDLTESV